MPWACRARGGKFVRIKTKTGEGVSTHDTLAECHAAVRAANAGYRRKKRIRANADNEFRLFGPVGGDNFNYDVVSKALESADKSKEVSFRLNSRGGSVTEAVSIFNLMHDYEGVIHTINDGWAASAAGLVLLGGNKISARKNSVTMFHAPRARGELAEGTESELENLAGQIRAATESFSQTIQARTGKSADEVKEILAKDSWYSAQEAKDNGIVDDLLPINPRRLRFQKDDHVPAEVKQLVASYNEEVYLMTLRDLCATLEIDIEAEAEDNDLESAICNHVESLTKAVEEKTKELDELKAELEKAKEQIPPPKTKLQAATLKLVADARETRIDSFIESGHLTPAAAKITKERYLDHDRLSASVTEDGDFNDGFESEMDRIKENGPVLELKQKSRANMTAETGDPNNGVSNPMLDDVERRRKEAGLD